MTKFITTALIFSFAVFFLSSFDTKAHAFEHSFRLAQISVFQKDGDTFSGMLTYSPKFELGLPWRGDIGASLFKSAAGKKNKFLVLNARLLAEVKLSESLIWEVGPGVQYWKDNGDLQLLAGTNFVYPLKSPGFGFVDHVFLGYNGVIIKNLLTHEILIGFGI